VIEAHNLTTHCGEHVAVSDLSFSVEPSVITVLGRTDRASLTVRWLILGLNAPTAGIALGELGSEQGRHD
jgi:hypothetical protein